MLHVQREVWRLPLEGCDMGSAVVVESLADGAIDCQAIADLCQLFRDLSTAEYTLHMIAVVS